MYLPKLNGYSIFLLIQVMSMIKGFVCDLIQLWKEKAWKNFLINALQLIAIDYFLDWILIGVLVSSRRSTDVLLIALQIMLALIILRELIQMSFSPKKYISSPENRILLLLISSGKYTCIVYNEIFIKQ